MRSRARVVFLAGHDPGSAVLGQVLREHCHLELVAVQPPGGQVHYGHLATAGFTEPHFARVSQALPGLDWTQAALPDPKEVSSFAEDTLIGAIQALSPTAIVVFGTSFFPRLFFRALRFPWVTLLPYGLQAEIFRMDRDRLVASSVVRPQPMDDRHVLPWLAFAQGLPMLVDVLERLAEGPSERELDPLG